MNDLQKAENVIEKKKFEIEIRQKAKGIHKEIEIMESKNGNGHRSIKDFNYIQDISRPNKIQVQVPN